MVREIGADLAEVQAQRGDLVAVEDDLRLRHVELQIGIGKHEDAALECARRRAGWQTR